MRKKHDELTQAFKDKNRKLLQTQELYDKLKRKAMFGQLQGAAEDAIDSTLQAASGGMNSFIDNSQNHATYPESGDTYGQLHSTIQEQPRASASYQPAGTSQGQGGTWFRTVGAQCMLFPSAVIENCCLICPSGYPHHPFDTSSTSW